MSGGLLRLKNSPAKGEGRKVGIHPQGDGEALGDNTWQVAGGDTWPDHGHMAGGVLWASEAL